MRTIGNPSSIFIGLKQTSSKGETCIKTCVAVAPNSKLAGLKSRSFCRADIETREIMTAIG